MNRRHLNLCALGFAILLWVVGFACAMLTGGCVSQAAPKPPTVEYANP